MMEADSGKSYKMRQESKRAQGFWGRGQVVESVQPQGATLEGSVEDGPQETTGSVLLSLTQLHSEPLQGCVSWGQPGPAPPFQPLSRY